MTSELSKFAARLREFIHSVSVGDDVRSLISPNPNLLETPHVVSYGKKFNALALELFALQFTHNAPYRRICEARLPRRSEAKAGGVSPKTVEHWTQIPAVPTSAFKELELSCLSPSERKFVFHSSGTTEQKPSRHFHNAESLAVYEASLWAWFARNVVASDEWRVTSDVTRHPSPVTRPIILTPSPAQAPHSSLAHMLDVVRRKLGGASVPASRSEFLGHVASDGAWTLDFDATLAVLQRSRRREEAETCTLPQNPPPHVVGYEPMFLLGTAFSFVHLLDFLVERNLRIKLPPGSRVMETGGYKGRSRTMPKAELHSFITERLGVPASHIICEYGMSELSSQAYDLGALASRRQVPLLHSEKLAGETPALPDRVTRHFRFPPWSRVQIISPETGREVAEGETGLIRVFDLANVFSVMAIQTEDLAVRHADGFELIGRAALAESRGCSLMTN